MGRARILYLSVIRHPNDQTMRRRIAGVAGNELTVVIREREVERSARIGVDDLQVGVRHGELAEPQNAAAMIDVIGGALRRAERRGRSALEYLHDVVSLDLHGNDPAAHMRG